MAATAQGIAPAHAQGTAPARAQIEIWQAIERKVQWLATAIVDAANAPARKDPDGLKIGGHQASSASMVTIMTALDQVLPAARATPIVTVLDGHPHTLAFLAAVRNFRSVNLGVTDFGQTGTLQELYQLNEIGADAQVSAALDLLDRSPTH